MRTIELGTHLVGVGHPCFVIAEIGINHNGDIGVATQLIDVAAEAGCDAVKFQKRTPELAVPQAYRDVMRETPWGMMTYLDYRHRVEFGQDEYEQIHEYCNKRDILWFASPWDTESVAFLEQFDPPCHKAASAALTDVELLDAMRSTPRPLMISTGMSTAEEMDDAVERLGTDDLLIAHATSTYPCPPEELNLRMIQSLQVKYSCPIGYSGHESGLQTTCAAVALGACFVERHITLDRGMWGSDQGASVEPTGLRRLVRDIRVMELALGDGIKKLYNSELSSRERLRK